jgi:hypothetical protein
MHLGGPPTEKLGFLGKDATDELVEKRAGRDGGRLQIALAAEDTFIIAADGIEGEAPGVSLVRRSGLEESNDRRLHAWAAIFDCADKGGHVRKMLVLAEVTSELDVGVHAVFELAVELKKEAVFEKHGGVALLGVENL